MRRYLILVFVFLLINSAFAGKKKASAVDVQLPNDYAVDFQLGIAQHARMVGSIPQVKEGPLFATGSSVFETLTRESMIGGMGLPYQWKLTVLNDNVMNAGSMASGEIEVNGAKGGMAEMLGDKPGLWAAVLSHEISHTANRHQVRQYMYQQNIAQQLQYYRWRVANGDKSANWSILGLTVAAGIAEKKMGRDQEHEADLKGMMLMARAGFHPDNVFALHHLARLRTGDQSKFAAFFSDHPRWETRDQRDQREYSEAVAEFQTRWPDPKLSPGGEPPTVVFVLAKPLINKDKKSHSTQIRIPVSCRNSSAPIAVLLMFSKDGHSVPALDSSYQAKTGELQMTESMQCSDQSEGVSFVLPSNVVADKKLRSTAMFFGSDGKLLESVKEFDVELPK